MEPQRRQGPSKKAGRAFWRDILMRSRMRDRLEGCTVFPNLTEI
jgi:hypothetical protein